MAAPTYAVHLAAVPVYQIDEVRERLDHPDDVELVASRVVQVPHDLIALEVLPLGPVLAQAIDTGQPLRNDAWHPLRAPIVVDPETVTARARRLQQAVQDARSHLVGLVAEAVGPDVDKVLRLYAHASRRGEAVVTFLTAVEHDDRARGALVPHVRVANPA